MSKFRVRAPSQLLLAAVAALLAAAPSPVFGQEDSRIEGFTEPYADLRLAAAEMGTVAEVAAREGDQVSAGQLLASLDDAVLKAALEVARAGMQSVGALNSAMADLKIRKTELEKLTELRERNHASQQEVDRVAGEIAVAEARVQAVREELEIKRLEFERIKAQLGQRQIRTPISGVVVEVFKDQGEFVSPTDPVVARVVQLDPLLVVFSIPVEHRGAVSKGQSVPMQIGTSAAVAEGIVEYVSPAADASSGTVRVKVKLPNPAGKWHSGEKSVLLLDGLQRTTEVAAPEIVKRGQ
ncbi:MAG: efflux RND transporter periplasmic adaptor subunit [Planctomycetaceae bacterium]